MRMKRKKNLDERIAASSDYLITMKNDSLDFQDAIKENHLLDFNKIFKKEQPVYLEIGCGKGQFGNTFAHQNPDKNILCVERNRNVLIMAIDKAKELGLDNIMFLCGTAKNYYFSHYKDFGSARSYGYRRVHLGNDLLRKYWHTNYRCRIWLY
mgnify:CR=1 FL=1